MDTIRPAADQKKSSSASSIAPPHRARVGYCGSYTTRTLSPTVADSGPCRMARTGVAVHDRRAAAGWHPYLDGEERVAGVRAISSRLEVPDELGHRLFGPNGAFGPTSRRLQHLRARRPRARPRDHSPLTRRAANTVTATSPSGSTMPSTTKAAAEPM